ncbi:MAG: DUF3536 domain-containing protein [Anaerolineaceae bacterium]
MSLCIHGHFYQPPREDPISDYIPDEIGAQPFKNWNERILAECYAPNAHAGNFKKISFNVGPTLFGWMDQFAPEISHLIIQQERSNYEENGVGNGMAQGYHHVILPLAKDRDKITQVRWGIKDFELHFGHKPEGLWLPETAVDLDTLAVLSDCGIRFTILAPWQVQPEPGQDGPYLIKLPGDRPPFVVFCYDQELSTRVSFHPSSTNNGDVFLDSILQKRPMDSDHLTLIASDGELYGHHQHFRDYFLSYILNGGGEAHGVDWTYPGKWLSTHTPKYFAQLKENTSWSCMHGVSRWKEACGCTPGATWKKPLRLALDQIAEWVDTEYQDVLAPMFDDPWELRHRYIEVMAGHLGLEHLCLELAGDHWKPDQLNRVSQLLEAQYERQRMFTSCGFYHDEFHRIEPQNNIAYAAKAVWLTNRATGLDLSPAFMDMLKEVKSQKTGLRGDTVFSQTLMRAEAETEI